MAKLPTIEIATEVDELRVLRASLTASVRMQTHYARLLNSYDSGTRPLFDDREQFIKWIGEKVRDVADGCPRESRGRHD